MNVIGLRCACRPRSVLAFDHYSSGACPDPPFPLEWIEDIMEGIENDDLHRDGRITATRVLGCPRQSILSDEAPIAIDLRREHTGHWGDVMHARLASRGEKGADGRLPSQVEFRLPPTTLLGVEMTGRVDKVSADWGTITDYKTHGESSMGIKWDRRQAGKPDRETAAQLNIYRLLIARGIRKVPDDQYKPTLVAWHMAQVKARRGPGEPPSASRGKWTPKDPPPPAFKVVLPIMTEGEIARLRPYDDDEVPGTQPFTVSDIVGMFVKYRKARAEGATLEEAIKQHVPLVGRGIWKGTMCTRYCTPLEACDAIEGLKR